MRTDDDPMSGDDSTSASSEADGGFEARGGASDAPLEPFSEVLSGVMDEHDPDSTGELDLPAADDDLELRPAKSDPGFDGWLDDDPYAALADDDDDAAAEIADWVAFTSGAGDEQDEVAEMDVVVDVTDASVADVSIVSPPAVDESPEDPEADESEDDAIVHDATHGGTVEFFVDADSDAGDDIEVDVDDADGVAVVADAGEVSDVGVDDPDDVAVEADDDGVDDHAEVDEPVEVPDGPFTDDGAADDAALGAVAAVAAGAASGGADSESEDPARPSEADAPSVDDVYAPTTIDDPNELRVIPIVPIASASTRFDPVDAAADSSASSLEPATPAPVGAESGDDDDTGEVPVIAGGFSADDAIDPRTGGSVFDFDGFDDEAYKNRPTREHQDLAAAMVAADSEDTQQVALSAAIPGLESGVVGFDDVVAAGEGDAAVPAPPRPASNLLLRVGTGATLVVAFLLSLLWRPAITVLALAAFVVAAGEFYSALMHRRYRPMSVFGFVGIIGASIGAVVWGVVAIPIAFGLLSTVILLYGAVSRRRVGGVSGFALTVLVAGWIGGFGSFAFPIIAAEEYQVLVLTVVAIVALVDISAYFVGSSIGRRPLAPTISPKKTVEGFVGGTFMAFLAGAGASFFIESIDLPTGLILGAVVAVIAPLGDLAVSVVKRSLGIKDMGSILPGHGGLLDRIDAIIAVVPAAWAVFVWAGLL